MKAILKKIFPRSFLQIYHRALAKFAAVWYGNPSEKLIVIGITGTKGKSTTVNLISKIFAEAGYKTGITSTLNFKIDAQEWLSDLKMTMPGRFYLQKLLRQMVQAGCQFAIVETSSEGIAQFRHSGIWYDCLVFTNLTPEHIEAHGGFENYKQAKLSLFRYFADLPKKNLSGKIIPKAIAANIDDEHAQDFLNFSADKKITYSIRGPADFQGQGIATSPGGIKFTIRNSNFSMPLLGKFDIYNALGAIAATSAYGINLETAKHALEKVKVVPGRMELIENEREISILVDYAYEPESLRQVYETISLWPHGQIIHVLGPTGGGRDRWRRPVMGKLAANSANTVIITTDDPYDDNRVKIMEEMAQGAVEAGKKLDKDLFLIADRREAIRKALNLASPGDLVLITGKGAEQVMAVEKGKKIPWDDRRIVREELEKLANSD